MKMMLVRKKTNNYSIFINFQLGVQRPSESHNLDDGNSNIKINRSNRNDFRYDTEYNPSK